MRSGSSVFKTVTLLMVLAASSITAAGPGKLPVVPLAVIVEPMGSSGMATRMTGDSGGPYVDGLQGVIARLTEFGGLLLDFQVGGSARRVFFDYSQPVAASNGYYPPTDPVVASNLRMSQTSSSVPMQSMANGSSQCIALGTAFDLNTTDKASFRNLYQRPGSPFDVSATSYALVTRVTASSWEVETGSASCDTSGYAVALLMEVRTTKRTSTSVDRGLYHLPFRLTLIVK